MLNDADFLRKAAEIEPYALMWASESLKMDGDFINEMFTMMGPEVYRFVNVGGS